MPLDGKVDRLGKKAYAKTQYLNNLIQILQNTTIGTINTDINNINNNIDNLYAADQVIHNKLNAISSIFDITFNPDGTLLSESYSTHTHP
jgi:hypothetical protein